MKIHSCGLNLNMSIKKGMQCFLSDYLDIRRDSKIVFLSNGDREDLVEMLVQSTSDIGSTAIHIPNKLPFSQIARMLDGYDLVVFLENTSSTYRNEIDGYCVANQQNMKIVRVFDFSSELFTHTFNIEKNVLRQLNKKLIGLASKSGKICAKSDRGTDLEINLDKRFGWVDSCGHFGSRPAIFPVSEVATYSSDVSGVLVADGALNTNFGFYTDPRISGSPVTIQIENSVVKNVSCEDYMLRYFLSNYFKTPFCDRIGEVGIGTNYGIPEFVPFLSHINERFPSLHIGFGANNQGEAIAGWNCPLHLDLILGTCDIWIGHTCVLQDRNFINLFDEEISLPSSLQVIHADTV
jgi:aminopeptidase